MRVSLKQLKYAIEKLNSIVDDDIPYYDLTSDLFSDEPKCSKDYLFDKPYAISGKGLSYDEKIILYKYFEITCFIGGKFDINTYCIPDDIDEYIVVFDKPHLAQDLYFHANFRGTRAESYNVLDFGSIKKEIIKFVSDWEELKGKGKS